MPRVPRRWANPRGVNLMVEKAALLAGGEWLWGRQPQVQMWALHRGGSLQAHL